MLSAFQSPCSCTGCRTQLCATPFICHFLSQQQANPVKSCHSRAPGPGAGSLPPRSRRGVGMSVSLQDRQTPPPNPTPRHPPRAASLTAKEGCCQQSSTPWGQTQPPLGSAAMTEQSTSSPLGWIHACEARDSMKIAGEGKRCPQT